MKILTIKTDQEVARIALWGEGELLKEKTWQAHRELSNTILQVIDEISEQSPETIEGIIVFKGPGSFTGLRIGITVANTLAYSLDIPIVATGGRDWENIGRSKLKNGENEKIAAAEYGGEANITSPRK